MRHKTSSVSPVGTDKCMSSLLCGAGCGSTHLTIFRCVWVIFTKTEKPLSVCGRLHRNLPFIFIDYVDPDFNASKRSVKPGRMKYKTALFLGWGTVLQERGCRGAELRPSSTNHLFFLVSVCRLIPGGKVLFKSSHLVLRRFERVRLLKSTFPLMKIQENLSPPPPPPPLLRSHLVNVQSSLLSTALIQSLSGWFMAMVNQPLGQVHNFREFGAVL